MSKNSSIFFQSKKKWDTISAYLFLAPALLGFIIFIAIPVFSTFVLSFFEYTIIRPAEFVGLDNIKDLLDDPETITIFKNTFKFLFIFTPMHCILGLLVAFAIYKVKFHPAKNLFRGIIYFPAMVTTSSVAIAFVYMFATDAGFINYYLRQFGFDSIRWLTDAKIVYFTLALFSFWKFIGNTFLYYFIGLNNVPETYYEAALIDGASTRQIFTKITIPLITPTIFFVIIINIIGVFQIFDEPFIITNGGPGISTRTVALHIYRTAFLESRFGYASIFATALFILIMLVTVFQFIGQKKWVIYDYE